MTCPLCQGPHELSACPRWKEPKPKVCLVDHCGGKVIAKGLCNAHYLRLRVYGRIDVDRRPRISTMVLEALEEGPGTAEEIAAELALTQQQARKALERLDSDGLVRRVKRMDTMEPKSGRKWWLWEAAV